MNLNKLSLRGRSSNFWIKVRFVLGVAAIGTILLATFWLHYWVLFIASLISSIGAFALSRGISDYKNSLREFLTDLAVALAFGFILVYVMEHAPGAEAHDGTVKFTAEQIVKVSLVFIVMFSAQIVARASRSVTALAKARRRLAAAEKAFKKTESRLQKSMNEITQVTDDLSKQRNALVQARLAGLAAKILRLKDDAFVAAGEYHDEAARALEASLGVTRAWVKASSSLNTGANGATAETVKGNAIAWWKMMEIYQREETFDVSRFEVATNVRNFAYVLLGNISAFLSRVKVEHVAPPDPDCPDAETSPCQTPSENDGDRAAHLVPQTGKLVVALVTPFAPKDFYNFPNGNGRFRCYHEAEFFGNYRRVISALFRDRSRIVPLRIFLVSESKSDADLGWNLEPVAKMAVDCARMHVVPTPLATTMNQDAFTLDTLNALYSELSADAAVRGGADDTELMKRFLVAFPPNNHPASRLPTGVKRYLWTPLYFHFGGLDKYGEREEITSLVAAVNRALCSELESTSKSFIDGYVDLNALKQGALEATSSIMNYGKHKWNDGQSRLAQIQNKSFESFLKEYVGADATGVRNGRLAEYVELTWGKLLFWHSGSVDSPLIDWFKRGAVGDILAFRNSIEGNFSWVEKEYLDQQLQTLQDAYLRKEELLKEYLAEEPLDEHEKLMMSQRLAQHTLDLVDYCQRIDAGIRYLALFKTTETQNTIASTGVELGLAEEWLHRVLILCEAARVFVREKRTKPIPLWQLLGEDLLGLGTPVLKKVEGAVSDLSHGVVDLQQQIKTAFSPHMTLCAVNKSVQQRMRSLGINPEFMLLGSLDDDESVDDTRVDASRVTWRALIATGMSEPFHTCRVLARFGAERYAPHSDKEVPAPHDELSKHVRWFVEQWNGFNTTGQKINPVEHFASFDAFTRILAQEIRDVAGAERSLGEHHLAQGD